MSDFVDTRTVHELFAAQRDACAESLRLGRQARADDERLHRDLAAAAIEELERERDAALRRLEEAEFLIRRLLDHAGGSVVLPDLVWAFGLCPNPRIVSMRTGTGLSTLVALRADNDEPWPPRDPWHRENADA